MIYLLGIVGWMFNVLWQTYHVYSGMATIYTNAREIEHPGHIYLTGTENE